MNDINRVLRELVAVFESLELRYAVMGGIAVRAYGIPRPTFDVDFTLAVSRDRLGELYTIVRATGYTVAEQYLSGWIDEVAGMPLVKFRMYLQGKGVDVDVFLAESAFQDAILQRRRKAEVSDGEFWLVSPEDLVLLKLLANRPRDVADILDVMFTQGGLDEHYLQHWASLLKVSDRLKDVLEKQREMFE